MVMNPRSEGILGRIISKEPFSNISDYTHALNAKGFHIDRATIHIRMGDLNFLSRVPYKEPLLNKKTTHEEDKMELDLSRNGFYLLE